MSSDVNLNAYFERIGFAGSIAPTLSTLEVLHGLHPAAIPFENLNPLIGAPVSLDPKTVERKLVQDRRGGYCYEQNLLFQNVLENLGFVVRAHLARVLWGRPQGVIGPRSHMVLSVELGGATYLADVGFGGMTLTAPLKLKSDVEQETPHETFRITGADPALRVEAFVREEWRALYQFDLSEQVAPDYEIINYYASSHPQSRFVTNLIASRPVEGKRYALLDTRLTTHIMGADSEIRIIGGAAELRDVLTQTMGITLPVSDLLDPALEKIVASAGAAA